MSAETPTGGQGDPLWQKVAPSVPGEQGMRVEMAREDEILTSREAMELLKIGRTKLWELTRTNMVPAYRLGVGKTSSLRYKRSDLLRWLESKRV